MGKCFDVHLTEPSKPDEMSGFTAYCESESESDVNRTEHTIQIGGVLKRRKGHNGISWKDMKSYTFNHSVVSMQLS